MQATHKRNIAMWLEYCGVMYYLKCLTEALYALFRALLIEGKGSLFERQGHQKPQLSMNVSHPMGRMGWWEGG